MNLRIIPLASLAADLSRPAKPGSEIG